MKTIIAGSRNIVDFGLVKEAIGQCGFEITEVVSGGAQGVDLLGEEWARQENIPIKQFLADWSLLGKAAGPIRNRQMAEYVGSSGALVLIWDGQSKGSANMLKNATAYGLKIFTKRVIQNECN